MSEPDPDGTGSGNPLQPSVTYHQYDGLNRLVATMDAREGVTRFTYDSVGNQTSLADPVLNTTTFTFDRLNRLVADTNALGKSRTFEYDAAGNQTKQTDRRGKIRQFTYDNLHRLSDEKWYDGAVLVRTLTWGRDLADQLSSASDPAATYSYEYNKRGNVELVTAELAGLGSSKKIFLRQTYDHLSRRDTSKAAIGSTEAGATKDYLTDYTFDALSRLTKLTQDGQSGGNQVAEKRVDLAYNAIGQFTSIARYKDLDGGATHEVATTEFLYDALGRLTDLDHKDAGVVLTGYNLTYDNQNRLTRQEFTNYSSETADFQYDAADQLTKADRTGTSSDESYVNDLNGNRRMSGTSAWTVDPNNRLFNQGAAGPTYYYDDEGNRTSKLNADGSHSNYTYDHRNRLTNSTDYNNLDVATQSVDYVYDVFDRVVKRTHDSNGAAAGGVTEEYRAYDGDDVALRLDNTGAPTHRYLNGVATDQVLAEEQMSAGFGTNDRVLWALTDQFGTVRDLYNNVTGLKNHLVYDSFGKVTSETAGTVNFLYGFAGYLRDEATGFSGTQTRWYDPTTARWISEDWIGFRGGDANLSRYVGNSPTLYVDPLGEIAATAAGALTGAAWGAGIGAGVSLASQWWAGNGIDWEEVGDNAIAGAVGGAVAGAALGAAVDLGYGNPTGVLATGALVGAAGALGGAAASATKQGRDIRQGDQKCFDWGQLAWDTAVGGLVGAALGAASGPLSRAWGGLKSWLTGGKGGAPATPPAPKPASAEPAPPPPPPAPPAKPATPPPPEGAAVGGKPPGGAAAGAADDAAGQSSQGTSVADRAKEVHDVLDPVARDKRTTVVLQTAQGPRIVAGGRRDLTPAQRRALKPGEQCAKNPHKHAETTALKHAEEQGLTPEELAATRKFCPACKEEIEKAGGQLTSDKTAVFPAKEKK